MQIDRAHPSRPPQKAQDAQKKTAEKSSHRSTQIRKKSDQKTQPVTALTPDGPQGLGTVLHFVLVCVDLC
jgi:hypothetical protein